MSKKPLDTKQIGNELREGSVFFQTPSHPPRQRKQQVEQPTSESTQNPTQAREVLRKVSSGKPRQNPRDLPSRDEIQEFSFRLRDTPKVKVQAEVPGKWQQELDDLAYILKVGKLELYRFILGEFLGKVERKKQGK